jgi:hypothetical protein
MSAGVTAAGVTAAGVTAAGVTAAGVAAAGVAAAGVAAAGVAAAGVTAAGVTAAGVTAAGVAAAELGTVELAADYAISGPWDSGETAFGLYQCARITNPAIAVGVTARLLGIMSAQADGACPQYGAPRGQGRPAKT